MEKVEVRINGNPLYRTTFQIGPEDINLAGHMSNERILVHVNRIKDEFFCSGGFTDVTLGGAEGTIIANNVIVYKSEAFEGDRIEAEVFVDNLDEVSFDLKYRFKHSGTDKLLALVKTGTVYFDYTNRRIKEIPIQLSRLLSGSDL